jgi:hypothetical protein
VGVPKLGFFDVLKLWMFIFFSNEAFLEHGRAIYYSPYKDISMV